MVIEGSRVPLGDCKICHLRELERKLITPSSHVECGTDCPLRVPRPSLYHVAERGQVVLDKVRTQTFTAQLLVAHRSLLSRHSFDLWGPAGQAIRGMRSEASGQLVHSGSQEPQSSSRRLGRGSLRAQLPARVGAQGTPRGSQCAPV